MRDLKPSPPPLTARLGSLLLVAALVACGGPQAPRRPELLALPDPDLSAAEAGVREQVGTQRAALERLLAAPRTDLAELAQSFADLGSLYMIYDFLDDAGACFENADRLQPDDHRWPYYRGYLAQRQGRLEDAIELLGRSLELRGDNVAAIIRLGRSHLERGAGDEAEALFARALELEPESAAAEEGLGKVAALRDDHRTAVAHFAKALVLEPGSDSLHYALGQSYRKLGDLAQARRHLEKSGDVPVPVRDPLLAPLAVLSGGAQFYLTQGGEALADGRYEEAAESYRRALEIDPRDFEAYKACCYALEKIGDLEAAIGQLDAALEHATTGDEERDRLERAEICRIRGGLQVLYGRDGQAIESFTQALELDPGLLDARVKLGNALARNRRFAEAIVHFDQILAARPDDPGTQSTVLSKRATALVNLGRGEEALADFRRAVAAAPEDPELRLRYAAALEFLGQAAAAERERARAAALSAAIGDAVRQAELVAQNARRRADQGDYPAAIVGYREALRLAPESPSAADHRYRLALCLERQGQLEEALAEYRQVIDAESRHTPARRGEVTILILLGRYGEARMKIQEALRLAPRDVLLAHTQARMLATTPDRRVRDGKLALALAQRLHQAERDNPRIRETLAMAFAERGFFPQARQIQRQLVADAQATGRDDLLPQLRAELAAYERGESWTIAEPEELLAVTMRGPTVR